mmetsp:Transcript_11418/g.17307  ORF Transcript_11418/g.17307 Transcript_11418/m.17307 type:complete len:355 (-) Transcript_11418:168-1232(-)
MKQDNATLSGQQNPPLITENIAHILSFLYVKEIALFCRVSTSWMEALAQIQTVFVTLDNHADAKLRFATKCLLGIERVHLHSHCYIMVDYFSSDMWQFLDMCSPNLKYFRWSTLGDSTIGNATPGFSNVSAALQPLRRAKQMIELRLECGRFDTVEDLTKLCSKMHHLECLSLGNIRFGKEVRNPGPDDCRILSKQISRLKNLKQLYLSPGYNLDNFVVTEMALGLKNLQSFEIGTTSELSVEMFASCCSTLRILRINYCSNMTLYCVLKILSRCPIVCLHLRSLRDSIGISHVQELCQANNTLRYLYLEDCSLWHDEGLFDPAYFLTDEKKKMMIQAASESTDGRVRLKISLS